MLQGYTVLLSLPQFPQLHNTGNKTDHLGDWSPALTREEEGGPGVGVQSIPVAAILCSLILNHYSLPVIAVRLDY